MTDSHLRVLIILIVISMVHVYWLWPDPDATTSSRNYNAFIISFCNSWRYNFTVTNLERGFPGMFNFICVPPVPLNDSRVIEFENPAGSKKWASLLVTTTELFDDWIPQNSLSQDEWNFWFEDDVDILPFERVNNHPEALARKKNGTWTDVSNYNEALIDLMENQEVQNDGFFYLGICGPTFSVDANNSAISSHNRVIQHYRASGYCLHAQAITPWRAKGWWEELKQTPGNEIGGKHQAVLDQYVPVWSVYNKILPYVLGGNFEMPVGQEHYGLVYQNRSAAPPMQR